MLRELEGADGAQNRAADIAKQAIDRSGDSRKRTARNAFIAAVALIAAALVTLVAWQAHSVKVAGAAVTTMGANINIDRLRLQVTATP